MKFIVFLNYIMKVLVNHCLPDLLNPTPYVICSDDKWPSPRKKSVSTFFIFRKRLQTIYNKIKSYRATELTGCALES